MIQSICKKTEVHRQADTLLTALPPVHPGTVADPNVQIIVQLPQLHHRLSSIIKADQVIGSRKLNN